MSEHHAHLLIIEDEPVICNQLASHFDKACYKVSISRTAEGILDRVAHDDIDICLIDTRLPGKDGITLTRELRAASDVGIILVGGGGDPTARILGLESGADDCMIRPIDPRELLSRIKSLLWRVRAQRRQQESGFRRSFQGWTLDLNKRELTAPGGEQQSLSAAEFHLLFALLEKAGEVLTRDQLMNRVRNRAWYPDDRYIDVLVGQVRRKFRRHDRETTFISTIHGAGYLFAPTVT